MKNSNKKIDKLEEIFYELTGKGKDYKIFKKLNELVDKVNELPDMELLQVWHNKILDRTERAIKKLESKPEEPKKECEHEYEPSSVEIRCRKCHVSGFDMDSKTLKQAVDKQIIYTSEGDAVGEVEKMCEHTAIRPEGNILCLNCETKIYWEPTKRKFLTEHEYYEPKKD